MLQRFIQKGTLRVIKSDGSLSQFVGSPEPVATIRFHDPSLPLKLFRNPELHAGEATGLTRDYMFETEQLYREQDNQKDRQV